ncbi:hypothetical protein HHUSO_G21163 [Huso huso]|uniref:Uncharacterized protein n=1 Tax=Huso huso TaxID=61971 RepID=A0ABR0Z1R7_HUSHU
MEPLSPPGCPAGLHCPGGLHGPAVHPGIHHASLLRGPAGFCIDPGIMVRKCLGPYKTGKKAKKGKGGGKN